MAMVNNLQVLVWKCTRKFSALGLLNFLLNNTESHSTFSVGTFTQLETASASKRKALFLQHLKVQ